MTRTPAHTHVKQYSLQKGIKIMKKRNIAAAILLASMMAVSTCAVTSMTAMADYTINITDKPANDAASHTYTAYQVFSGTVGTVGGTNVLTGINWGNGVNGTDILTDLKATSYTYNAKFASCKNASDVAKVLEANNTDTALVKSFAGIVRANLTTTTSATGAGPLSVAAPGYYYIKDEVAEADKEKGAVSDNILKVVDATPVNATVKEDVPTLTKAIGTSSTDTATKNTAKIGDKIPYVLTSTVPKMEGYTKYYYVIDDTMEAGLTFNNDIVITIGGTALNVGTDYTVDTSVSGKTFEIVFKDFLTKQQSNAGQPIVVTYSATLNSNAELVSDSNDNTVQLTYSNNPHENASPDSGNPDKPSDNSPVGKTPEQTVNTYTTGLELIKVDENDGSSLANAKFGLTGTGFSITQYNNEYYKLDNDATTDVFYQLKDGTYTDTAYTADNSADYASSDKYVKVNSTDLATSLVPINVVVTSDANGKIKFKGLNPGTYTLTEIEAPDGYNKLSDPVTIIISGTTENPADWSITVGGYAANKTDKALFKANIANNKGTTLPSTGGIGTTIFYVVGGTLVAGAVVLLITKKRMSINDQK